MTPINFLVCNMCYVLFLVNRYLIGFLQQLYEVHVLNISILQMSKQRIRRSNTLLKISQLEDWEVKD